MANLLFNQGFYLMALQYGGDDSTKSDFERVKKSLVNNMFGCVSELGNATSVLLQIGSLYIYGCGSNDGFVIERSDVNGLHAVSIAS